MATRKRASASVEESTNESTLRALGAQVQLRIGTAAIPSDLSLNSKPQYTALQQTLSPAKGAPHRCDEPND